MNPSLEMKFWSCFQKSPYPATGGTNTPSNPTGFGLDGGLFPLAVLCLSDAGQDGVRKAKNRKQIGREREKHSLNRPVNLYAYDGFLLWLINVRSKPNNTKFCGCSEFLYFRSMLLLTNKVESREQKNHFLQP